MTQLNKLSGEQEFILNHYIIIKLSEILIKKENFSYDHHGGLQIKF